ncbi:hypothetical protein CROQUDRAFT_28523, partial [Cronartium quercuum f. sp. fusiforme G11]
AHLGAKQFEKKTFPFFDLMAPFMDKEHMALPGHLIETGTPIPPSLSKNNRPAKAKPVLD